MNINAIDLRQLRYFVAVAEELHFGRAARRLNISQPPLSQQIKALEHFLGVELFWRSNRRVELTPAGNYLLPEARRLLSDMALIANGTKRAEAGLTGRLRIGVHFSAPFHPITAQLLQKFRTKYPHIQIELVLHERPNLLQLVDLGTADLDLALIWLDYGYNKPSIHRMDLACDELQVVLPNEHPMANKPRISIKDLVGVPLNSTPRHAGTQLYEGTLKAFAAIGEQPLILHETPQMPLVASMVAAGQGLALLPSFLKALPISGIKFVPLHIPKHKTPHMTYNLVTPARQHSAQVQNFMDMAARYCG